MNKLSKDIINQLKDLKPQLEKEFGIKHLKVFGSVSRGEARQDSDVDLIAEIENKSLGWRYFSMPEEIGEMIGRKVDVLTQDSINKYIKDRILREAKDVY